MDGVKRVICRCRYTVLAVAVIHVIVAAIIYSASVSIGPGPLVQAANIFFYLPLFVLLEVWRLIVRFLETPRVSVKILSIVLILLQLAANTALVCMNLYILPFGLFSFALQMLLSLLGRCWFYLPAMLIGYSVDWIIRQ